MILKLGWKTKCPRKKKHKIFKGEQMYGTKYYERLIIKTTS